MPPVIPEFSRVELGLARLLQLPPDRLPIPKHSEDQTFLVGAKIHFHKLGLFATFINTAP